MALAYLELVSQSRTVLILVDRIANILLYVLQKFGRVFGWVKLEIKHPKSGISFGHERLEIKLKKTRLSNCERLQFRATGSCPLEQHSCSFARPFARPFVFRKTVVFLWCEEFFILRDATHSRFFRDTPPFRDNSYRNSCRFNLKHKTTFLKNNYFASIGTKANAIL